MSGNYNINSGYGQLVQSTPFSPGAQVFAVGDSTVAGVDIAKNRIRPHGGINRYFATIDAAISACTANRGDTIYIMPGHAETVTATSIALDVAGITIIGLGNADDRPTFTFGAAAATITVSGANCSWSGCRFVGNFLDVASAFTLGAAKGFTLSDNLFEDAGASLNFLSIVTTGATDNDADDLTVDGNIWHGLNTTPLAFVSILAAENRPRLLNNEMYHAATSGAEFVTLAAKIVTAALIKDNIQNVVGATGTTTGVFLTGSGSTSTGNVMGNVCGSLDTTSELMFTAGTGLKFYDNLYTGVADKSGYIVPAIDAA